jgi:hypothetical protein
MRSLSRNLARLGLVALLAAGQFIDASEQGAGRVRISKPRTTIEQTSFLEAMEDFAEQVGDGWEEPESPARIQRNAAQVHQAAAQQQAAYEQQAAYQQQVAAQGAQARHTQQTAYICTDDSQGGMPAAHGGEMVYSDGSMDFCEHGYGYGDCPRCRRGFGGHMGHKHGWGSHCFSSRCRSHSYGLHEYLRCKFGYFIPAGNGGVGAAPCGHYARVYPVNPDYNDPRDGRIWAAQGYGVPMAVPLAPVVGHTYNYGWGIPSSRLTPVSRVAPY